MPWAAGQAGEVAGEGVQTPILTLLKDLVDKSLVVVEKAGGDRKRYRLLEPIRQYALDRLRESGWEDDLAFANRIGFTDIVKRPTARASDVRPEEFAFGRPLLEGRVSSVRPELVIFSFKATAEAIFGRFDGNGFIGREFAGAEVFVMPGPYAARDVVASRLGELHRSLRFRCGEQRAR